MSQKITYSLDFKANVTDVQGQLNKLKTTLSELATKPLTLGNAITPELREASQAAATLQTHLKKALDPNTGKLDLSRLNLSLKNSGQNAQKLAQSLINGGQQGRQAFMEVSNAVLNAQKSMVKTNTVLQKFANTLMNTARWQLSSSLLTGFTSALSTAVDYTKELNQNLTNIRIVSGGTSKDMERLTNQANQTAKRIGSTTNELVSAQLIYRQQGDSAAEAAKKAEITAKAANVSFNSSAEEMSEHLTGIWNSYRVGSQELELYVDKLMAVGAATATSGEEIATSMTKVAATASTVGVTYDQLIATIATVSSATRVSAEQVGTAFKTIYARMGDLQLEGSIDEDGVTTTLGEVSGQLAQIGVDIKGTDGQLRDMGSIVEEIGAKWQSMGNNTKTAIAQALGGKRQYTQIFALFENWDEYGRAMSVAANAQGTLNKQNEEFMTGMEAAGNKVTAAWENIVNKMIDDDTIVGIIKSFGTFIEMIDWTIDKLGGIGPVLLAITGIIIGKLAPSISAGLQNMASNFYALTGKAQGEAVKISNAFIQEMQKIKSEADSVTSSVISVFTSMGGAQNTLIENTKKLTTEQREYYQAQLDSLKAQHEMANASFRTDIENAESRQGRNRERLNSDLNASENIIDFLSDEGVSAYDRNALNVKDKVFDPSKIFTDMDNDDVAYQNLRQSTSASMDDIMQSMSEMGNSRGAMDELNRAFGGAANSLREFRNGYVEISSLNSEWISSNEAFSSAFNQLEVDIHNVANRQKEFKTSTAEATTELNAEASAAKTTSTSLSDLSKEDLKKLSGASKKAGKARHDKAEEEYLNMSQEDLKKAGIADESGKINKTARNKWIKNRTSEIKKEVEEEYNIRKSGAAKIVAAEDQKNREIENNDEQSHNRRKADWTQVDNELASMSATDKITQTGSNIMMLASAWTSLSSAVDAWKGVADGSVEIGDALTQSLMSLGIILPGIVSGGKMLAGTVRGMSLGYKNLTTEVIKVTTAEGVETTTRKLGTKAIWEKVKAQIAEKMTSPIGWAMLAVTALLAVVAAVKAFGLAESDAAKETKKFEAAQKDLEEATAKKEEYQAEVDSLESLSEKLRDAAGDTSKLVSVQKELNEVIGYTPGLITGSTTAYTQAQAKLKFYTDQAKKSLAQAKKDEAEAAKIMLNTRKIGENKHNASERDFIVSQFSKAIDEGTVKDLTDDEGKFKVDKKTKIAVSDINQYINDSVDSAKLAYQDFYDKIAEEGTNFMGGAAAIDEVITNAIKGGYSEKIDGILTELMDEDFQQKVAAFSEKAIVGEHTEEELQEVLGLLDEMKKKFPEAAKSWESYEASILNMRVDPNSVAALKNKVKDLDTINKNLETEIKAWKTLNDLVATYNTYGKITREQFEDLLEKHPKYLDFLKDENGLLSLNTDLMGERLADLYKGQIDSRMFTDKNSILNQLTAAGDIDKQLKFWDLEEQQNYNREEAIKNISNHVGDMIAKDKDFANNVDKYQQLTEEMVNYYNNMQQWAAQSILLDAEKELKAAQKSVRDAEKALEDFYDKESLAKLEHGLSKRQAIIDKYSDKISNIDFTKEFANAEDGKVAIDLMSKKLTLIKQQRNALQQEFNRLSSLTPSSAEEAEKIASTMRTLYDSIKDSVQTLKETELELLELPYNTLISLYEKQNEVLNGQYETYEKIKQAAIDDEYNSFSDYSVGIALVQSLVYDDTSEERLEEIEEENAKILDEMDKHLEEVADLEDKAREEKRKKDEEERAREKQDLLDRKKEADELLTKATNNMAVAKKSYASFAVNTIEITDNLVQALKLKIDEGFDLNQTRKSNAVRLSNGLLTDNDPRGYSSGSYYHYDVKLIDPVTGEVIETKRVGGDEYLGFEEGIGKLGTGRIEDVYGQRKYAFKVSNIYNNPSNFNFTSSRDGAIYTVGFDENGSIKYDIGISRTPIEKTFRTNVLEPYFSADSSYNEYKKSNTDDIINALIEEIMGAAGGGNESGLIGYIKSKVKDYQGSKPTGPIPGAISSGLPLANMPETPSSYFGSRIHPIQGVRKDHSGIDLAVAPGTRVYATEAGEVIMSSWNGGYGNCVMIDHGNGIVTLYGHNSKLLVKQGDKVKKGASIAEVGATGNVTGPHLHYEVRYNGTPVNPLSNKYLQLPAYAEGGTITTNDEVLIGEEGQELVYYKGKWFFVDDPTIFEGLEGAKVYSAEDVKNMRQYVSDAKTIATTDENKDSTLYNRYKDAWMESLPETENENDSAIADIASLWSDTVLANTTFDNLVPEDLFWAIQDQDNQILSSEKSKNREKLYNLFNKNSEDIEFITNNLSTFQKQHSDSISELYHKYSKGELTQEQVLNEKAKADLKLYNDSLWQSGHDLKTLFETKDQLQYILDNKLYEPEDYEELIIHIQNVDKTIQTTTENMKTSIENYNKTQEDLVDSILKPAEDYFEKQDFYSLWDETNDTKIDGWIRVLKDGLSNPDLDGPAKEAIRRAVKEGLDSAVNESLQFLEQQAAKVKEPYEAEVKRYQQIYDLTSKHHASVNKLEEALHKANLELQQSVLSEKWLDEETRKTVYNTGDYLKQITKIKDIQKEENVLYKDYKRQIQKLNDDDVEQAEKLTKEYENQLALKEKELEILNAELDIVKKRNALTTALEEKNVRVFVGGRWTYMSNYQNVQKAAQDLANSEYNLEKARTGLAQKEELLGIEALKNKSQEIIDEIDKTVKATKKTWEDFNYELKDGATSLDGFKSAVRLTEKGIKKAMEQIDNIVVEHGGESIVPKFKDYTDSDGVSWSNNGLTFKIPSSTKKVSAATADVSWNDAVKQKHASGSFSTIGGWAQVNEEGFELYGTKDGQFIELNPGEKIFNNEQFKYLYNISKNKTGLDYLPSSISNSMTVGEVHLTLPNVHDTESFIEGLRNLNSYLKNNNYS